MAETDLRATAWMHTLHMELDQTQVQVTLDAHHPFGVRGKDYDPSYTVTSEPLYSSAALAAVQQETTTECATWMQHLHGCDSLIKSIYIERNEQGERITHLEQHVGDPMTPANKCSCGLSEHLKALSAPKAPRQEAAPAGSPQLTFQRFSEINRLRCESADGFSHQLDSWSTSDWFTAILGELGEAANVAKKLNRVRDGVRGNKETADVLRVKLRQELADAFVYLDLLAQHEGFQIGAAAVEVFNAKSEELGCPIRITGVSEAKRADQHDGHLAAQANTEIAPPGGLVDYLQGEKKCTLSKH